MCIIKREKIFSHHLEFTIALHNILSSFWINICPWHLFQWIISCTLMCKDVWWLLLWMDVFILCHICYPFVSSSETYVVSSARQAAPQHFRVVGDYRPSLWWTVCFRRLNSALTFTMVLPSGSSAFLLCFRVDAFLFSLQLFHCGNLPGFNNVKSTFAKETLNLTGFLREFILRNILVVIPISTFYICISLSIFMSLSVYMLFP